MVEITKKYKKIDFHTHILPQDIPNFKEKFGYGGFISLQPTEDPKIRNMMKDSGEFFRKVECNCWDPEERINEIK